ncbi:MAG: hypothetical protein AB7I36_20595 [Rhodospirillaceae bacterium]
MTYLISANGKFAGRVSEYSEEKALAICLRYAAGETIGQICASEGMPGSVTLYRWRAEHPDFAALLACAREDAIDKFSQEVVELADNCTKAEDVPVAKLQIEQRKWRVQMMVFRAERQKDDADRPMPRAININLGPAPEA